MRAHFGHRGEVHIFVGNVTHYGPMVRQWISEEGQPLDAMGLAYHHLDAETTLLGNQRLEAQGWPSNWAVARPTGRSEQGTHGGVCWMRRTAYQTSEFAPTMNATAIVDLELGGAWRFLFGGSAM